MVMAQKETHRAMENREPRNKASLTWSINVQPFTGMSEFNSEDHYIYYYGQESLRRNGVSLIVSRRVGKAVLGCNLKNDKMICLFPRETIQHHGNSSLCPDQ